MADRPGVRRIAFLAPMKPELAPLVKRLSLQRVKSTEGVSHVGHLAGAEVLATMTGIGTQPAREATERMLDAHHVDHVIVVGVAGGIHHTLSLGDVIVPEVVVDAATGAEYRPAPLDGQVGVGWLHTSDEFIKEEERLRVLVDRGFHAVDMETSAIGAVCEDRGVGWSVFRGISDDAFDAAVNAEVLLLASGDGKPDLKAVSRFVAADPGRVRLLARLAADMRRATDAAVTAAVASVVAR